MLKSYLVREFLLMFLCVNIGYTGSQLDNHTAWSVLDKYECGDSASDRIIGGTNAVMGQYPWIARLGYVTLSVQPEGSVYDWMCGGTLVTDRHVVTGAHCVPQSSLDGITLKAVRLGEYNTKTNPDCTVNICAPKVQDRRVKRVVVHPDFNQPPFHNDIALIELLEPVELNNYVAPICLPRGKQDIELRKDEAVTVAGWGKTNMTTDENADILQTISLPVLEPQSCSGIGSTFKVGTDMICAGGMRNKDTCTGDSGGPLMRIQDTPDGPKYFLVGVVSFGPTVCGIRKPGVYSKVSYFMKFLLDNIVK